MNKFVNGIYEVIIVHINKYLKSFEKDCCPDDCELKNRSEIEIISVPSPEEIFGVIISRDPTVQWPYIYLNSENDIYTRQQILFSSAIPLWLFNKIQVFMRDKIEERDMKFLFDIIFHRTYWTHLHKCQTDINNKISSKFKSKNANRCADRWLPKELQLAIENNAKFIITLGTDVQKWVYKWNKTNGQKIEIIDLPHPSGNNNSIWYRTTTIDQNRINSTEEQIMKLINLRL